MRKNSRAELLQSQPLFSACTKQELETLSRYAELVEFEPGEILMREGVPGDGFFVVVSGEVRVTRQGELIATVGPGRGVGEQALLDQGPRTATVTAATPVTVLLFARQDFWSAVGTVPTFDRKLLVSLATRLRAESVYG